MNEDLRMFNSQVQDSIPDCELGQQLYAFYCQNYQVVITKASETTVGIKVKSVYKLAITGDLTVTRFVEGKENVLVKAYLLINEHFSTIDSEDYQPEEIIIYENEFDRTFNYPFELEA